MAKQYLMSLDLGGSGGRALLYDTTTGEISFKTIAWDFLPAPSAGDYAFDLGCDAKWDALCRIGREALTSAGAGPGDVAGISVTSMRHGMVLLDKAGRPLVATPNKDARAITESMELQGERGAELYQRSGHVPSPVLLAPRLVWLKNNHPEQLAAADVVLTISDWMAYKLCGVAASEPSQAGETLLFDLEKSAWAMDIIQSLGLPERIFPKILKPGDKLGGLMEEAAGALGLKAGTPVAVGGADSQLGLLGLGVTTPGEVTVVAGSTTPVMVTTNAPRLHPEMRTWAGMHVIPGVYVAESNAGGMGTALEWIAGILYADSPDPVAALSADAARSVPGAGGILSTVGTQIFHAAELGLPVEGLTFSAMTAPGGLAGRGSLARGVLEGMAFASLANAQQALDAADLDPERVFAGGGMTRSPLFCQLLADSFGRPATTGYGQRTTPFGAVICAAVGAGLYPDLASAAKAMCTAVETIQPSEYAEQYDELYEIWSQHLSARGPADEIASEAIMQAMQAAMEAGGAAGEADFRPHIYIAASIGEDALAQLRTMADVTYAPYADEGILSGDEMIEKLQDYQVLVTEVDLVDADALQGLNDLRMIICCRGNPVNVDIPACTAAGVPVVNTPGRNADAVADLAMAYILMLFRKLDKATAFLRQPDIEAGDMGRMGQAYFTLKASELWKKTVGVVGGGAIGRRMIRRLLTFDAKVLLFDPYIDSGEAALLGAEKVSFEELLARSDVVTLHAPVTDETTGMMNAAAFERMRDGAFLVNTARAALIEQDALLGALQSGKLGGGAFDVFPVEPPGSDDPLLAFENVIVTPHIGGNTNEIGIHQGEIIIDEISRLLRGQRPNFILNPATLEGFQWTGERRLDKLALEELAKGPGPGMTDLDVKAKEEEAIKAQPEDQGKSSGLFSRLRKGTEAAEPSGGTVAAATGASAAEVHYAQILESFLAGLEQDEDSLAFAKKKKVSFQFILKGSDLQFYMGFGNGDVKAGMGEAPFKPDVTVKMDADTFDGMFTGRIDGNDAFKSGKLSVSGNMLKAMSMQKLDFGKVYAAARDAHGGAGDLTAIGGASAGGGIDASDQKTAAPAAPASAAAPAAPDFDIFNRVLERFTTLMNADSETQAFAERKNVTFQFNVKDAGALFYLSFIQGKAECGMGEAPMKVDVTIKTDAATLDGMFSGRQDGAAAFKTGKLSVGGNMMKAMTMQKLEFSRLYQQAVDEIGDPGLTGEPTVAVAAAAAAAPSTSSAPAKEAYAAPAVIHKVGDIRDEILEINNELYARGWITYTGGNISARTETNPEEVWITPSGINKGSLRADMMVKIDLDGNVIGEAQYNASSERMVHTAIMRMRPEIKAVIHTHAANATLMALTDTIWEPISADAAFFGQIPVVPFIMPGSTELADLVAEAIGKEGVAAIMQNHGLVVAGTKLRRAADTTESIELTAAKLLLCRQLGVSPAKLPDDAVEMLQEMGTMLA